MSESTILDLTNRFFNFCQKKLSVVYEKSFILGNIDNIIFVLICLTLICSTFMHSEHIGILAVSVVFFTLIKLLIKKGSEIKISKGDGMIVIYFLICLLSVVNSTLPTESLHGFLKTVIYITFYFAAANYFQENKNKIKYILGLIGILCFAESIIAIFQNLHGVQQIAKWQDAHYVNPEDIISRAYGTLKPYNPNLLGGYLVSGIPCIICTGMIAAAKKHYKSFLYSLIMFLVCGFAIFITGSRGAYLGFGAIILGLIAVTAKIIHTDFDGAKLVEKYWKIICAAVAAAIIAVLAAVPQIAKRIMSIFLLRGDSSTSFRMNVYHSSFEMLRDNWIMGIGVGNRTFREVYGLYMMTGFDALSTYSVPLEIAVESGIFALLSFVAFLVYLFTGAINYICKPNDLTGKIILSSVILTVTGVMIHGLFDTIYFRPQVQFVFWTMIAMASAVLINSGKCEKEEEKND